MKYHISPTTGNPNQCRAQKSCPFGGEDEHYSSKEEARAAYEAQGRDYLKALTKGNLAQEQEAEIEKFKDSLPKVTSLSAHKAKKAIEAEAFLETARAAHKFDESFAAFPRYELSKEEVKVIENVAAGKKVAPEKIDAILEDRGDMKTPSAFMDEERARAAAGVLGYLKAVRSQDPTPSTLSTLDKFDPATSTLFSNRNARANAVIMGRAIRRENSHSEWMRQLASEHRNVAAADWSSPEEKKSYLKEAEKCENKALKSEARVQAQLKEMQYCFDNDEEFKATANAEVTRMLSKGWFRPHSSSFDGVPIGTTRKVKS